MTHKLSKCITIASETKFKALQSQQRNLKVNTSELAFKWEPCLQGQILQIVFMPIVYPVMLLFIIFEYLYKKINLAWKIRSFQTDLQSQPDNKSLYSLWKLHGLDKKHADSDRLTVLEQWIAILYPDQQIDFSSIRDKVISPQINDNAKQNAGNLGAPHFSYVDEINFLIKQLDLPDYQ